jgi:hypothetical protein
MCICSGRSRLELRARVDGEEIVTDVRAGPVGEASDEAVQMTAQGYARRPPHPRVLELTSKRKGCAWGLLQIHAAVG